MPGAAKTRFAVVGMSSDHVWYMGDGLAGIDEVELVAVVDADADLRQRGRDRWSAENAYADYVDMFERERPDAILVCGDNASKPGIVELATARGIHIYQDKPMAADFAGACRSAAAAEASGTTLMIAYHGAFDPIYDRVKKALEHNAIGRVFLARGSLGHVGPAEFGCSADFCEWLFDKKRNGGGAFIDEACYLVDEFVDCLGPIVEVSGFTAHIGHRDHLPEDVEDNAVAILRFASGALGVIDSSWGQAGPLPVRTSYHGTTGSIVNGRDGTQLVTAGDVTGLDGWGPSEPGDLGSLGAAGPRLRSFRPIVDADGSYSWDGPEQRHFLGAVIDDLPIRSAVGPKVALHVQEVIEAFYRSATTRQPIPLPLSHP
jgi:predicted dehydrogenase